MLAVAAIAAGNLAIVVRWQAARRRLASGPPPGVRDISNLHVVDDILWRGGAPNAEGYRMLAAAGVSTVVDLRAEDVAPPPQGIPIEVVRFPIRDGQPPSPSQEEQILAVIGSAEPPVFVHCAAGVGRTGSVVGAYLVSRDASTEEALDGMLGVGPPSLEQISYVAGLATGRRPGLLVTATSRILDAPRRTLSRIRG